MKVQNINWDAKKSHFRFLFPAKNQVKADLMQGSHSKTEVYSTSDDLGSTTNVPFHI